MELRHLRCFVVLAEELHFTRAAERLHIEQPPLSRTIKELEDELGALLFDRDRRGTRLTQAGSVFLQDIRRLFTTLDQARENARAVSAGCRGSLRIVVSDNAVGPRLSAFLARCRENVPEVEIRVSQASLVDQRHGLRSGAFQLGFAHTSEVGLGIVAEPIWQEPLILAVPTRHPLLAQQKVTVEELVKYPLLLCDPTECEGLHVELQRLLRKASIEPNVAETASSLEMMFTLVAAGYGVGFATAARVALCGHPEVIPRTLAMDEAVLTTYLLRPDGPSSLVYLEDFVARLHACADEIQPHFV